MEHSLLLSRPKAFTFSLLPCAVPAKTPFLGNSLVFDDPRRRNLRLRLQNKSRFCSVVVRAAVKRRKELPFDNVVQRDKKLKLVLRIRKILASQPDRTMSLRQLGRFRRALGLTKKRRVIALLKKFPAVFEIVEEGVFSLKFRLTPEAEQLYLEELKARNEMEDILVIKLRKLLMMSLEKRILLEKIAHLRTDLGLPLEFRDTMCHRYPQYFRVVATGRGPALELTHWDDEIAVSAAELAEEDNRAREMEEQNLIFDRAPKFNRVKLPKGLLLSRGEMKKIGRFRDMPYISPYSDFSGLRPGTPDKEKHACGVVHELLSLTIEKRTLVDHLTHFREEFRFSQQLRGMLIRHPDMFYVSLKGDRDSVFLREAYRNSQLIDKDKLLVIKERLRALVSVSRYPKRGSRRRDADEAGGISENIDGSGMEDEDGKGWSDMEGLGAESGFDDSDDSDEDYEDDDEDDWSDEDEETPPDFGEEPKKILSRQTKPRNESRNAEEKALDPVFPDGRPRERW